MIPGIVRKSRIILVILLIISTVTVTLVGGLVTGGFSAQPATIPVTVQDPIQIMDYPTALSLFPGQSTKIPIAINNLASLTYTVSFEFKLNDSDYQARYATFSNSIFTIAPGVQTFTVTLTIAVNAAPTSLLLTISRRDEAFTPPPTLPPNPTFSPSSPQPSSPQSDLTNASHPSVVLFQAGAKWASPTGTKALYVNYKDDWLLHGQTDGKDWGPWDTVETMDAWRNATTQALLNDGFEVAYAGEIPSSLAGFDLLVIEAAWGAVHPSDNLNVRNFVAAGGGVVITCITPCFFSVECTDRWPYRFGGTNLASLADWFGYANYLNVGGSAYPAIDNPFGTSLSKSDRLFYTPYGSAASVYNSVGNTTIVAWYNSGSSSSITPTPNIAPSTMPLPPNAFFPQETKPFAFTHTYGLGRVYWQAHIWPF